MMKCSRCAPLVVLYINARRADTDADALYYVLRVKDDSPCGARGWPRRTPFGHARLLLVAVFHGRADKIAE